MALEFDGKKYARSSTHQKEWGKGLIAGLHFFGNESILDLGCGDGSITALLSDHVAEGQVVGIDASRGMIEQAEQHRKQNLEFRVKDINDLDVRAEFDLIFSNAILHWIHDHKRLLQNCCLALKPGGGICFNFAADGNCENFNATALSLMKEERFEQWFLNFHWPWYMPSLEEYKTLMSESELLEIKVWGENCDRYFSSVEAMAGWIDQPSIVPFLEAIKDTTTKQRFRDELVSRMIEKTKQPDGTFFETFRRINVSATKSL